MLAGVTDVDGPALSITAVSVASGGGSWSTTATAPGPTRRRQLQRPVSFSYTASDGTLSASSTAALTSTPVNDAPVATPVTLAPRRGHGRHLITAATLLAGVTDVDGPALSITAVSVASGGGSLVDNGNGTWTYTPAANDNGPVSFSYTASDGTLSARSTASLTLTPVNDAPVASAGDARRPPEDSGGYISSPRRQLLAGVTDVDGPAACRSRR